MQGPNNNPLALASLYPAEGGSSTTEAGGENNPGATNDTTDTVAAHSIEVNFARGLGDSPVWTWLAFAFALGLLMYLVTRIRGAAASNLKFTLYNLVVVTGLSILGGSIAKVIATKWHIPFGISTIVNAS